MLKLKNDGATTLAADINSSVTSIPVVDGSVFPTLDEGDWFPLTIMKDSNVERMRVTARAGNTLTVIRGEEGTNAQAWVSGDSCLLNLTAGAITEIMQGTNVGSEEIEEVVNLYLDSVDLTQFGEEMKLAKRIFNVGDVIYLGEAEVGSIESNAVWRIQKINTSTSPDLSITWAMGTSEFDKIMDEYLSYEYL